MTRRRFIGGPIALVAYAAPEQAIGGVCDEPQLVERQFTVPFVNAAGEVVSAEDGVARSFREECGGRTAIELTSIPGGSFTMGSDSCPPEEQPLHAVTVPEFYLGTYPVTRKQWRDVSALPRINRDMAPLFYSDSVDHETHDMLPVDFVRLTDIDEFFARLKIETGRPYRMPSEAEWEYACRAGTSTVYHFGDAISLAVVNYNALQRPLGLTPVGSKKAPNRFGLHDMHGNVLERTADQARDSYVGAPTDGSPWLAGPDPAARIARGGMFLWGAERARSSARTVWYANAAASGVGFRLALSACPAAESGSTA